MNKYNKKILIRTRFALLVFVFMIIAIILKLGYLMILKHEEYVDKTKKMQYKEELIMPKRGTIYDSNLKELAVSIPKYDYWIELKSYKEVGKKTIDSEKIDDLVKKIKSCVKTDEKELRRKLGSKEDRIILLNKVNFEEKEKLVAKKIRNTWFDKKIERYYPYGNFASYVIGHTADNNLGLAGVESSMDSVLKGIPGKRIYVKDANGQNISIEDMMHKDPVNGQNIMLTIDEVLQHNMEKNLRNAYEFLEPKSITGILMETKTGNILAMSTVPDYNPNLPREPAYDYYAKLLEEADEKDKEEKNKDHKERLKVIFKMWRNPSINDAYEPGSPFKLITSAAALDENKTYAGEYFYDNGYIEVGGQKLKNWTNVPFGRITFQKGLEQSVNTVFVQLGQRLGVQKLEEYAYAFGFGSPTNINLPGEATGYLKNYKDVGPVELANMSYGQGLTVTPIQLLCAINAIGNKGELLEPNIVKATLDEENNIINKSEKKKVRTVISSETAKELLSYMESVVENGSGRKARVEGYRIAGKTGSANKVVEGQPGYAPNKFICSFAAIAPAENPAVTLLILVDESKEGTQSGSISAAPVAGDILKFTLKYLGINQNIKKAEYEQRKTIEIPNLKGKSYSEAVALLGSLSLIPTFEDGIVVEEKSHVIGTFPEQGKKVEPNSNVMLYMKSDSALKISMPNLIGMTKEQAENILNNLGIEYNFVGTGKVKKQIPSPLTDVDKDFTASIVLE